MKGNFSSSLNKKIQKILNVEKFSMSTLLNEILDLYSDLGIVCDEDFNFE